MSSEVPELRNKEDAEQEDDDVEWQSHLDIIRKLVSAHTLNQEVGLIADRR